MEKKESECDSRETVNELKDTTKPQMKSSVNKENKYRLVESRYKTSTNKWVNKKLLQTIPNTNTCSKKLSSKHTIRTTSSKVFPSRALTKDFDAMIVTPNVSKQKMNEKSISGSVKTGSRRKSQLVVSKLVSRQPLECSSQTQNNKTLEDLIIRTRYLQSMNVYMNAKHCNQKLDKQSINQINNICINNNELRQQLIESIAQTNALKLNTHFINGFQLLHNHLSKYVNIRQQKIDPIFNSFALIISELKVLLKIESDEQLSSINEFIKCGIVLRKSDILLEAFNDLYEISNDLQNVFGIKKDIENIKSEFVKCAQHFEKLMIQRINYHKTEEMLRK